MRLQMCQVVLYCDRVVLALRSLQGAQQLFAVLLSSLNILLTDWIAWNCCMLYWYNRWRQFWQSCVEHFCWTLKLQGFCSLRRWCSYSQNNILPLVSKILTVLKDYSYYPLFWFTDAENHLATGANFPDACKLLSPYTPRNIEVFVVV